MSDEPPDPGSPEALGKAPIVPKRTTDTSIVGKFEWPKDIPGESKEAYQARKDAAKAEYDRKKAAAAGTSTSAVQREALKK